jgi:hypothetical protein
MIENPTVEYDPQGIIYHEQNSYTSEPEAI